MSKKDELRQQLLEKTLGKNAKNRSISSFGEDLQNILRFQSEQLKELSSTVNEDALDKINKEMEKDFGVKLNKDQKVVNANTKTLDEIEIALTKKWQYKEIIHNFINFIKKAKIMEKSEYSSLLYNYKSIDLVLSDCIQVLYENQYLENNDINTIDFTNYPNKNEILYQDLYRCLYGNAQIIIFDHIESLPKIFIQNMISLLKDKEITLMNRYVEQDGILKETSSQLVKNAISTLTWKNKFILLLSYEDKEDISDKFGTPFIKAIDECIAFKDLDKNAKTSLYQNKINTFKEKIEKQCNIKIRENIIDYIHAYNVEDVDTLLEDIFGQLLDMKGLSDIEIRFENGKLYVIQKENKNTLLEEDTTSFEEIDAELKSLIGLESIKEYLYSLKSYYATLRKRKAAGKKVADVSKHMIFSGNPGTGKTTVARILAKYLKASGILESGHLIEVTRKDLVGQYVGHTAQLTGQVISSALGGVLFIDEAYSLYRGNNDSYGLEAIDTLVKYMEDYREELVVVLAGYKKEMEEFLTANSGLRSRFSNIIHFDDYTGEEIYKIACSIAKGKDYIIDENAKTKLIDYFTKMNAIEGGNGRLARNAVEKAMISHSLRNSENDILILEDFMEKGSE